MHPHQSQKKKNIEKRKKLFQKRKFGMWQLVIGHLLDYTKMDAAQVAHKYFSLCNSLDPWT